MNRTEASDRSRSEGPLPKLLLLITVSSGMLDTVSFFDLGNVFVAAMTGNLVFLGIGMIGLGAFSPAALSLSSYAVGAICGGRLAFLKVTDRGLLLLLGTTAHAVVVMIAALLVTCYGMEEALVRNVVLVLLALSMGWQYSLVLRLKVPDLTTTVVTTTITRLFGQPSPYDTQRRRVLMIGSLLCGVLIAALLRRLFGPPAPLWAAGFILATCASLVYFALRRPDAREWR
ncbi:YoaK family protein [Nonomuraea sp. CA-218870]|uniref:YoaK family protein n=1 Tax=Nonomuraea sp. CA-218870 TaxID=3239998 RepID=UPI003D945E6E